MTQEPKITAEQVDAILPQTQCGLCEYAGCKPYADAIINQGERINKCPPGGVSGLKKLGALLEQDVSPYINEMQQLEKPHQRVVIQEDVCIGCMKCIKACPVDAIFGAAKLMHTVIEDECNGCELCIPVCPVDCIYITALAHDKTPNEEQKQTLSDQYRQRYEAKQRRTEEKQKQRREKHLKAKPSQLKSAEQRKAEIKAAIARARNKKQT